MFDKETNLYSRDGKYIYPKHKSANGKKDFWARGDGWVLAGLAKVLQDMPKDYKHYQFFVDKFQKLAKAVAEIQQPEGYWTRSMMDPEPCTGTRDQRYRLLHLWNAMGSKQWLSQQERI